MQGRELLRLETVQCLWRPRQSLRVERQNWRKCAFLPGADTAYCSGPIRRKVLLDTSLSVSEDVRDLVDDSVELGI